MHDNTSKHKIVLIGKDAIPGRVKTRLTPHYTFEQAAEIYRHIALYICDIALSTGYPVDVSFQGDQSSAFAKALKAKGCCVYPQQGASLSEIIHAALQRANRVIALGMDMPLLNAQHLGDVMNKNELIFGPAEDGGYWMIAANKPPTNLFSEIEWSTSAVLQQSIERAQELNIPYSLDQIHYDIDTAVDLQRLLRDPLLPFSLHTRISHYA